MMDAYQALDHWTIGKIVRQRNVLCIFAKSDSRINISSEFHLNNGVIQGDYLRPLLYTIYLDNFLK